MDRSADSLPNDIDALRAFALNTIAERNAALAERDRLIEFNDRLRQLLRKAQGFEAKSERLARLDLDQLSLALEDLEQAIAKAEAIEEKTQAADAPRKRRINRGALPVHLPRVHETVAPADSNCPCCRQPMHMIGEETSERLDVIPAQYRVIVTHRPKLACRACERIVEAPAPEHLIKSGLPTEAMVASVLVAKYGWHLPLYRQTKMLAAQGLDLDRSTLAFWVGYAAAELMPLYERLKANLLTSAKLAVDETPVPVLDPGRGKTKTGYFWAVARDDRPWGGTDPPAVVYTYAPGRGGEHLDKLLANYRGIVQCDGYARYKKLPADRITIAFCGAGAICGASSSRSPSAAMRLSPPKRLRALRRSTPSRRTYGVQVLMRAVPRVKQDRARSSTPSRSSSSISSRGSQAGRIRPGSSAMASGTGMASPASSTTAASSSTPTSSSVPCARKRCMSHCALPHQVSVNIGSVPASATRHGRPFRATAVLTGSDARSAAWI